MVKKKHADYRPYYYIIGLIVILLFLWCAFYPNGAYSYGIDETGYLYIIDCSRFCCQINYQLAEWGITQYKCIQPTNGDNGIIDDNDQPYYDEYTCGGIPGVGGYCRGTCPEYYECQMIEEAPGYYVCGCV